MMAQTVQEAVLRMPLSAVSRFVIFNDYIIKLAEPTARNKADQLNEIGASGKLYITYERAPRPPLVKW